MRARMTSVITGAMSSAMMKTKSNSNTRQYCVKKIVILVKADIYGRTEYFPKIAGLLSFNKIISTIIALLLLVLNPAIASEEAYVSNVLQGIKAYKTTDFPAAKSRFIKAVLKAKTDEERAVALHNLGNVLFQIGDYANATIIFTDALRYNPTQQQTINNQKLTFSLFKLLEKRADKAALKRLNRTTAEGGAVLAGLPAFSSSTLNTRAINKLTFSLPEIPEDELNILLKKGMAYLQVMEGEGSDQSLEKLKNQQALNSARLYLQNIESSHSNHLWKRLFEVEEGFPAKLKKPENVPGVNPW